MSQECNVIHSVHEMWQSTLIQETKTLVGATSTESKLGNTT
jgi:hypothetical protein